MTSNKSWRGVLPVHPAADLFPLMEGQEFDDFVEDIRNHGLRQPILLWGGGERSGGQILDGRNRYRACLAAGVKPTFDSLPGVDPYAYVLSANIHRRHLTAEQKRELIDKLIKAQPKKSDLQISKQAKASPHTVGKRRAKLEAAGDVCKVQTRKDSRGREQPAHKAPPPPPAPAPPSEPTEQEKLRAVIRQFIGFARYRPDPIILDDISGEMLTELGQFIDDLKEVRLKEPRAENPNGEARPDTGHAT